MSKKIDKNQSVEEEIEELKDEVNEAEIEAEEELEELSDAEAKAAEHWERLLRVQAELENVQRRSEREVSNAHKYAVEKFVKDLLPVIDSMDMALKTPADDGNKVLLEGVEMTHKMLIDALAKHSIKAIDPEGEPFDPELHEAMSTQENSEMEADSVVSVLQKGYTLNDRLLRPALVVVAK